MAAMAASLALTASLSSRVTIIPAASTSFRSGQYAHTLPTPSLRARRFSILGMRFGESLWLLSGLRFSFPRFWLEVLAWTYALERGCEGALELATERVRALVALVVVAMCCTFLPCIGRFLLYVARGFSFRGFVCGFLFCR